MKEVEVVPYNPAWVEIFSQEASKLKAALGNNCLEIHHIGSTSVPNLSAKPIIDMVPVVKDILAVDQISHKLEALGYTPRGELGMAFRRFFIKKKEAISYNLHIWEQDNPEVDKHLIFRNYLIKHPNEAKNYEQLKLKLALKYPNNRKLYTASKDDLIRELLNKAGFNGLTIVQALLPFHFEAYHRIRKAEIFDPINIIYDPEHPTLTAENHFHFVYMKGTKVIGALHIEIRNDNSGVLRNIAIDEPYKNQDYGSKLLSIAERWIKHQGKDIIFLHANPRAVNFYIKAGFSPMKFEDKDGLNIDRIDLGKII
ncbi:MAG: hypothetical protein K0R02_565 [Rickettsiaceae bacterium]|jgi:GrpB-like predicted nucleotidyltransferase (UPF0157 family)|nr:hypothetical protein [Rickettsiaceae bacterium]